MLMLGHVTILSDRQQSSTKGSVSELSSALNEILTLQEMSTFQQTDTFRKEIQIIHRLFLVIAMYFQATSMNH